MSRVRGPLAVFLWKGAFVALFALLAFRAFAADEVRFDRARLTVETVDGRRAAFSVELAITDTQRMHGLMYRETMPADHGMLFDFGESRMVTMWMRNTVLPLDMLFIDEGGVVRRVREGAVPFSEELISSGGAVRYVLELNAGTARRLGIGEGSRAHVESMEKGG